jgi:anti-anti-sigma regulatory factor
VKVTIDQRDGEAVTLKIEGRLFGLSVPELQRAWQELAPSLGSRRLSVDLRGMTFIDATGKRLLAEIHDQTGAEFVADTPLTKYFAEQAQQDIRTQSR